MTIPETMLSPSRADLPAQELDRLLTLPPEGADPFTVVTTRGPMVESTHDVACAVVDQTGALVAAWGDVDRPVYPRSAIKPIQALPLVESGTADAFAFDDKEIALACASHGGELAHVDTVRSLLARVGLNNNDLECGAHYPSHTASANAMIEQRNDAENVHNNCSGKHTGMMATAVHLGEDVAGYSQADHPVQQRVRAAIEDMSECDLSSAAAGIDGCSLPTIGLPLTGLARAMARFGKPDGLPAALTEACRRVAAAMAAEPFMVAGHGRACTAIMEATGGAALVKTGAEGVYAAAIPAKGLGIGLKVRDGATRASQAAVIAVLRRFGGLSDDALCQLNAYAVAPLLNRRELLVGEVRVASAGERSAI